MTGDNERKFHGWVAHGEHAEGGKMKWEEFQVKPFGDADVDIAVEACGICASDLHTLRSGWGPTPYPLVVGHEIVGKAIRVGPKVEQGIKVGDRVGVGAQSLSCLKADCEECSEGLEQYCLKPEHVDTFGGKYPDGSTSMGGYADTSRVHSHFVFKIPDSIPTNEAAPMLCGGVTVYSPLKNFGAGPGKRVGVVGIGGLGHFAILFAKALGSKEVVAISRTNAKKEDALKLGADKFIATDEEKDWADQNASSLDLLISTVSSAKMPISQYLQLLRRDGTMVQCGAPDDHMPQFNAFNIIPKRLKFAGSLIGSPDEIREMLDLAAKDKIKPWVIPRPMKDANDAIVDMKGGKARYRYVLVNDGK